MRLFHVVEAIDCSNPPPRAVCHAVIIGRGRQAQNPIEDRVWDSVGIPVPEQVDLINPLFHRTLLVTPNRPPYVACTGAMTSWSRRGLIGSSAASFNDLPAEADSVTGRRRHAAANAKIRIPKLSIRTRRCEAFTSASQPLQPPAADLAAAAANRAHQPPQLVVQSYRP